MAKINLNEPIIVNTVNGKPVSRTMGGVTFRNIAGLTCYCTPSNDELTVQFSGDVTFREVKS